MPSKPKDKSKKSKKKATGEPLPNEPGHVDNTRPNTRSTTTGASVKVSQPETKGAFSALTLSSQCPNNRVPGKHNEKRKARPSFPDQPGKRVNARASPEPRSDTETDVVQDHRPQPNTGAAEKSGFSGLSYQCISRDSSPCQIFATTRRQREPHQLDLQKVQIQIRSRTMKVKVARGMVQGLMVCRRNHYPGI